MTEQKPIPPGAARITVEVPNSAAQDVLGGLEASAARLGVLSLKYEEGSAPESKTDRINRLLGEAELKFRGASYTYPAGSPAAMGERLSEAARLLADALKAMQSGAAQ